MRLRTALVLLSITACGGDSFTEVISPPAVTSQILVSWSVQRIDGTPLSCSEAQIETVQVSVGGEPRRVPCDGFTEPQSVFTGLPAGRYPIVIRLLGIGDAVLREHFANVDLGDMPVSYQHDFIIDQSGLNRGDLDIRWVLAGEPADSQCAVFGADRVVIESQPGSIAVVQADLPCDVGRFESVDILRGDYGLLFRLLDADRIPLPNGAVQRDFRVSPGQRTQDLFSFPLIRPAPSSLRIDWTINDDVPADVCASVGGQSLDFELFQQQALNEQISIRTATAACDAGTLLERGINTSEDPSQLRFRVSVSLRGFAGLVLTSTTVANVEFTRGETSTVTFDLRVQ